MKLKLYRVLRLHFNLMTSHKNKITSISISVIIELFSIQVFYFFSSNLIYLHRMYLFLCSHLFFISWKILILITSISRTFVSGKNILIHNQIKPYPKFTSVWGKIILLSRTCWHLFFIFYSRIIVKFSTYATSTYLFYTYFNFTWKLKTIPVLIWSCDNLSTLRISLRDTTSNFQYNSVAEWDSSNPVRLH